MFVICNLVHQPTIKIWSVLHGEQLGLTLALSSSVWATLACPVLCCWFHHHHHQSINREGRWGTTDDFATSFLHFSLFSTALWDLPNSRPKLWRFEYTLLFIRFSSYSSVSLNGLIWSNLVCLKSFDMVWCDLIWSVLCWSDLIWSGMIWSDLVWLCDLLWSDQIGPELNLAVSD